MQDNFCYYSVSLVGAYRGTGFGFIFTLEYLVNAEETCIYSIQQAFILCFQNLYDGQSQPTSSLQPLPSPCLTLSFQQYKTTNPVCFHPGPWFLRRGLLQTWQGHPFAWSQTSEFQLLVQQFGASRRSLLHFLLLERSWRGRIKV